MKKSIFYKLIYVCSIALIISGAVSSFILQSNYENTLIEQQTQLLKTACEATHSADAFHLSALTGGNRITVIDFEGNVISDSHAGTITENHKLRPEVSSALNEGTGISKRISATLGNEMLYIAIKDDNYIYRLAIPDGGVDQSFLRLLPAILIGASLAAVVAILLAGGISNSLIAPLKSISGNLEHIKKKEYDKVNFKHSKYEEIRSITSAIDSVLEELTGYIKDISMQNDKMDFILKNMGQALILVDENTNIIHSNLYADMLFKAEKSPVGLSISSLTGNNKISVRTKECIENDTSRIFDFDLDTGVYSIVIRPLHTSWQNRGAFILITDVSEARGRQRLRQEFVDGVVHDLRDPIADIGENAAILDHALKDQDRYKDAVHEITAKSTRMQEVIDDLLILNVLDEGKEVANPPTIHAYDICTAVEEKLLPLSRKMNISVSIEGNKHTVVKILPEHFEKIMTELMTNAIKYNEQNGKIVINLEQKDNKARISISNTGPGIDPVLIPRLFERFYREEQNRNARIQGAGLGLSIVKHILSLYDGYISVRCSPEVDTTFRVTI